MKFENIISLLDVVIEELPADRKGTRQALIDAREDLVQDHVSELARVNPLNDVERRMCEIDKIKAIKAYRVRVGCSIMVAHKVVNRFVDHQEAAQKIHEKQLALPRSQG